MDNSEHYECLLTAQTPITYTYVVCISFLLYFLIGIVLVQMYCRISQQLSKSTLYVFSFSVESKTNYSLLRRQISKESETRQKFNTRNRHDPVRTSVGELVTLRKLTVGTINYPTSNSLLKYIRLRRKLICMLIGVVVAFYACLFPLKVWNLVYMFCGHRDWFIEVVTLRVYWTISITVRSLFYINSSINPLLYNWLSAKFRYNFKKLLLNYKKKDSASPV